MDNPHTLTEHACSVTHAMGERERHSSTEGKKLDNKGWIV